MGKGKDGECANSYMMASATPEQVISGVQSLGLPIAYQVGGCVRDQILQKQSKDIDVMTCGVTPQELLDLCNRAGKAEELTVGNQLVGVRLYSDWSGPEGIEIALARSEKSTGGGHGDFHISPMEVPQAIASRPIAERQWDWSEQIMLDAQRRDFSCNAIYQNIQTGEFMDPTGGIEDLSKKILRAISNSSFEDDPLRVLRGLARVSCDGMRFDPATESMAKEWGRKIWIPGTEPEDSSVGELSAERVAAELTKILSGDGSSRALQNMSEWGMLRCILPEWHRCISFDQQSKYHNLTVDQHILRALQYADERHYSLPVKWAVLMHDIGKPDTAKKGKDGRLHYYQLKPDHPMWKSDPLRAQGHEHLGSAQARDSMKRLKMPESSITQVENLVRHHMFSEERDFSSRSAQKQELLARKMLYKYGLEPSQMLLDVRRCDLFGKSLSRPEEGWQKDADQLQAVLEQQKHQPHRIKDLAINGGRLIEIGISPGPQIGSILEKLLKQVVGQPEINTPEKLESIARKQLHMVQANKE